MQYMIIETYTHGPRPVYARFRRWIGAWSDIVAFEVLPVISSAEASARFGTESLES